MAHNCIQVLHTGGCAGSKRDCRPSDPGAQARPPRRDGFGLKDVARSRVDKRTKGAGVQGSPPAQTYRGASAVPDRSHPSRRRSTPPREDSRAPLLGAQAGGDPSPTRGSAHILPTPRGPVSGRHRLPPYPSKQLFPAGKIHQNATPPRGKCSPKRTPRGAHGRGDSADAKPGDAEQAGKRHPPGQGARPLPQPRALTRNGRSAQAPCEEYARVLPPQPRGPARAPDDPWSPFQFLHTRNQGEGAAAERRSRVPPA